METPPGPALRADHPRLLLELSREIVSTLDLQEVLARTLDSFRRIVPARAALLRLLEGDLLLTAAATPGNGEAPQVRTPAGRGLAGTVSSSVEPVYIEELGPSQADDASVRALGSAEPIRSYLGIALADSHGFLGVIELGAPEPRAFSRDQVESAVQLAPSAAIGIRNAQAAAGPGAVLPALDQDFMSLVAHELRTPLAVVLGCAETMAAKARDLDAEVIEDLSRRAVAGGHRLERLIADLFDMSRVRTGTLAVTPVPTSLRSIVSRAVSDAPQTLRVDVAIDAGLPLVDADPNRLVQVLRILLENAWKHAGETAHVEVSAREEAGAVTVEVADRGPGIAPQLLQAVFDPFVQAEDPMTRTVGGLGIGLFVARGICDLMGARIHVEERVGGGTKFVVRLRAATGLVEPGR